MNFSAINRKWLVCATLFHLVLISFLLPAGAEEPKAPEAAGPKPSATVAVDVLSQYVFRGVALSSDSAVIQPSITASYAGFSLNIWGNFDTNQRTDNRFLSSLDIRRAKWNETDITLAYTRELVKDFSVTGGTVYYSLPNSAFDAHELFLGASYNLPWFTVAFTGYREIGHFPGWWLQLDLTKSFPLPIICEGTSLDVGASFGYQIFNDDDVLLNQRGALGDYSEFHSATLGAALKIPVYKTVTIAPRIGVALPLTGASSDFIKANSFDNDGTHVFGGLNITATF